MPILVDQTENDLTIFTVIGDALFAEVMDMLERIYRKNPTLNNLWDLRQGSAINLTYDHLVSIVEYIAKVAGKRKGGKTALVSPRDVDYGILRTIDAFGELNQLPFLIQVFRDFDEAIIWISS